MCVITSSCDDSEEILAVSGIYRDLCKFTEFKCNMMIKTGLSIYFPKRVTVLSLYANYQDYSVLFFLDHRFSQNKTFQVPSVPPASSLRSGVSLNKQLAVAVV